MKKITIVAVLLIIFAGLAIMGIKAVNRKKTQQAKSEKIKKLPPFSFLRPEGGAFTNDSLIPGKPVVIIHFSPGCDHCQYEALEISRNLEQFKNTELLMITAANSTEATSFAKEYHLYGQGNIKLLLYTGNLFHETFGTTMLPAFFVYNRQHILVDKILGETKIGAITKHLAALP